VNSFHVTIGSPHAELEFDCNAGICLEMRASTAACRHL
jgi:hypothetical protein